MVPSFGSPQQTPLHRHNILKTFICAKHTHKTLRRRSQSPGADYHNGDRTLTISPSLPPKSRHSMRIPSSEDIRSFSKA